MPIGEARGPDSLEEKGLVQNEASWVQVLPQ
jgi:hypothetical protein